MQHSTLEKPEDRLLDWSWSAAVTRPIVLVLIVGLAVLCFLFFAEIRSAIEIWNASTAYGHCYLVLPMTAYLLWDRREIFARWAPRPELWWTVLGLPLAIVWLAAERLGIMEGRQLLAVAAVELLLLAVLGWRLFWALSGPLLYLFFLVPFGAFLTPMLQRFTAAFSIVGLNILGIPNYADNFIIETPAGVFFVAEACAGLRFLIAAIAFGGFYALLNFRSPGRRAIFIAASVAVPIIANGFRALGIVVLGQILGSAEAAAADHIIYGWVFFSFVMLLLVAAGHPFRESPVPSQAGMTRTRPIGPLGLRPVFAAALALVLVGVGPAIAALIDGRASTPALLPAAAWSVPDGCTRSGAPDRFAVNCPGLEMAVQITTFPARSTAGAMVAQRRRMTEELGAEDVSVTMLDGIGDQNGLWTVVQTTDPNRVTVYASWVDGAPVVGGLAGRLAQARDSLFGATHAPVLVTITIKEPERVSPQQRRAALDAMRALVVAQDNLDRQIEKFSMVVR